jgi:hypothetical protein
MRTRKKLPIPDEPTVGLVREYIKQFNDSRRYKKADEAIIALIQLFPLNTQFNEVLAKVCVINDLYSTRIQGTFEMAEHIVSLNPDKDIQQGSTNIVDRIANLTISGTTRSNYSFATKYCSWHAIDLYPIYDKFVRKLIMAYKRKDNFYRFEANELRKYGKYKQIYNAFITHYNLNKFSLKEIDKFLWGYGKVLFPNQTRKQKNKRNIEQIVAADG